MGPFLERRWIFSILFFSFCFSFFFLSPRTIAPPQEIFVCHSFQPLYHKGRIHAHRKKQDEEEEESRKSWLFFLLLPLLPIRPVSFVLIGTTRSLSLSFHKFFFLFFPSCVSLMISSSSLMTQTLLLGSPYRHGPPSSSILSTPLNRIQKIIMHVIEQHFFFFFFLALSNSALPLSSPFIRRRRRRGVPLFP